MGSDHKKPISRRSFLERAGAAVVSMPALNIGAGAVGGVVAGTAATGINAWRANKANEASVPTDPEIHEAARAAVEESVSHAENPPSEEEIEALYQRLVKMEKRGIDKWLYEERKQAYSHFKGNVAKGVAIGAVGMAVVEGVAAWRNRNTDKDTTPSIVKTSSR